MCLFKAERRGAGLGRVELEWSTRDVANPQGPHKLESGQSSQILCVPCPQLRVLGLLTDDRVFHNGVTEVIHHCRYGEDSAQPLVVTFSGVVCACAYALSAPAKVIGDALRASPATMLLRVIVEMSCAIAHLLGVADGVSEHWMARGFDRFS